MIDVVPPLLKSVTTSTSPSLCTPVNPVPPPTLLLPSAIEFWKNQKPCCASPLLSRRSEPKNSSSQVGAEPAGQVAEGGSEYLAAKLCSRLSLSGRPPAPSFHAHWLMSCGSFDPPPVKMVAFRFGSETQSTAVAPLVSPAVVHSGVTAVLVTW